MPEAGRPGGLNYTSQRSFTNANLLATRSDVVGLLTNEQQRLRTVQLFKASFNNALITSFGATAAWNLLVNSGQLYCCQAPRQTGCYSGCGCSKYSYTMLCFDSPRYCDAARRGARLLPVRLDWAEPSSRPLRPPHAQLPQLSQPAALPFIRSRRWWEAAGRRPVPEDLDARSSVRRRRRLPRPLWVLRRAGEGGAASTRYRVSRDGVPATPPQRRPRRA